MAAERMNTRTAPTPAGRVNAVVAPNARQTYVPKPTNQPFYSAQLPGKVLAILAPNSRQTHIT